MTDRLEQPIEPVTQADRDAAAELYRILQNGDSIPLSLHDKATMAEIRMGNRDDWPEVQSLARHRIACTTPAPSNTTDAVEKLQDRCDGLITELDNLVKAIAARKLGHYDIPSLYEYTKLNFPTAWQHSGGNNEN
jgi:hypothetical protein